MVFDPRKVGEEADSMIAALNQPQTPADENQPASNEQAIAADESQQAPVSEQATDQGVQQPTTPDISGQLAELRKQAEAADQRWRVLQGMIDKKDSEIDSLRLLLAQLSQQQQGQAQPPAPTPGGGKITPTDIQEYGSELIDLIGRKADEVFEARISAVMQQLQALSQSLNTVAQKSNVSAEQQFKAAMAGAVPEWEALNNDPSFIAWLQQPAPFTKESKLDLLRRAAASLDAAGAAEFFLEYKKATIPAKPEVQQPPPQNPARFAAPGRSAAPASRVENPAGARMWTRADIAKLYDDKMAGRISQKDFDELERDIFRAQRENRIAA